jgi:hypothetical protein
MRREWPSYDRSRCRPGLTLPGGLVSVPWAEMKVEENGDREEYSILVAKRLHNRLAFLWSSWTNF